MTDENPYKSPEYVDETIGPLSKEDENLGDLFFYCWIVFTIAGIGWLLLFIFERDRQSAVSGAMFLGASLVCLVVYLLGYRKHSRRPDENGQRT